ncbi:MAG: hypothetical protein QOK46_1618 [Microbacteriaceae bacterium]|jgi:MFS family permease|nr:hypothetical protein [Microbacteriaceae bacterium]
MTTSTPPRIRNNWAVVITASVCAAVGSFDLGGVNVVLPQLAKHFDVQPAVIQWAVLAYLLPIGALALPSGRWLDTVGRRHAIVLLVAGFMVTSILVGLSPNLGILIVTRGLQGCFGAGLFAMTPVLAYEAVGQGSRVRAIAVLSGTGAVGGIAGPSIGAFTAEAFGWPWIFWMNVPILIAAIAMFWFRMPRDGGLRWPSLHFATETLLLGGAASSVLLALTWAANDRVDWLFLAAAAIPCLVVWRLTHRGTPVLRLTAIPGFGWSLLTLGLLTASGMSMQYLIAFFAERNLGFSVSQTGLALFLISIAIIPSTFFAGWLSSRFSLGVIAASGFVLITAGGLVASVLNTGWGFPQIAVIALVLGFGQGMVNSSATTISLGFAPPELTATAGSAMSFLRNTGLTAGPALMSAIWGLGFYSLVSMRSALVVAALLALLGAVSVTMSVRGRARVRVLTD